MDTFQSRYRRAIPKLVIVGVDDGAFIPHASVGQHAILVATFFRNFRMRGVRFGRIEVDGMDAAFVLESMLKNLRFDAVLLSGISFGGFNIINLRRLSREISKPVIAISGKKPANETVQKALRTHFDDCKDRMKAVRAAGRIYSAKPLTEEPALYFEVKGATPTFARCLICSYAIISRLPEPIRVAGRLAKGLSQLPITCY